MAEKRTHKAEKYTPDAPAGTEPWDMPEPRYRIISTETGEILDDAQGYGYRTAQKAYAGYSYKTRSKTDRKRRQTKTRHIEHWLDQHRDFLDLMDETAFEIAKGSWGPDDRFDAKLVRQLFKDNDLEPDFTAGELLRVWRNM